MEQNQKLYLYQLIKSLSISEKGYVKKFCAKNGASPSYLKLFDAIDRQESYDEEQLKKKFKKEKFIKQLSVAKNYLIKTILRSLRAYHSEATNNIQVHELLLEIELLYNKRLVGLCKKLIKKAKKIIIEAQLYYHAEELAFWDFKLTLLTQYTEDMDLHMEEVQQFGEKGLESSLLLSKYRHLTYQIFKYTFKEGYSREEQSIKVAKQFSEHRLLKNPPSEDNAKALGRYYNIWHKVHEINTDFVKGYESCKIFVEVIHRNPKVFDDYIMSTVIPAHYNLLACCIVLNEEDVFYSNLKYLQEIPQIYKSKNESIQRLSYYYSVSLELQFYTHNAHFNKTDNILKEAEKVIKYGNLKAFGLTLFHIELCYSIAYAYFGIENYEESETWISLTLEHQKDNLREDIMCMAHLLHLVNHAELGNYQYLDYKLRSSYHFIKKMKKVHKFEKVTLQFLKKLTYIKNSSELVGLISLYKRKFEEIEHDPFERMIIKNFDIISLLESKLKNQDFATIAALRQRRKDLGG
jgi:hypothetical protein